MGEEDAEAEVEGVREQQRGRRTMFRLLLPGVMTATVNEWSGN